MRKKENWMKIGNPVIAHHKPGIITRLQENKNLNGDGIDYVYYIFVKLIGQRHDGNYHPADVKEGKIIEA